MRYMYAVNDRGRREALHNFLERELGARAEEIAVTIGQQLIEQGKVDGRLKGERAILLRLLRQRFGAELGAAAERRIASGSLEQLETWSLRVLSADSLAELLAD